MSGVALAGRIVFSIMFFMSGINHLVKRRYLAEYAGAMDVPAAGVAVPLSGLVLLAGSVMVAAGIWGDLGAALIGAFLLPTAVLMHPFWRIPEPQARQQQQTHFMKNVTMLGGCLMTIALFLCAGNGLRFAVTGPLFRR